MTGNVLLPGSHMRVCVQQQNEDAVVYNSKLQDLLPSIQASRPGTTIAYLDAYDALLNMIIIPEEYGKKVNISVKTLDAWSYHISIDLVHFDGA